jgi:quercetin dioxygenase-like cupin family protein
MKTLPLLSFLFLTGCCATRPVTKPVAGIRAETLWKSTRSWDGQLLPAYPAGQPEVTILRITIPPGTALPEHQHPVINAGVLLEGELTVRTEHGKVIQLRAGDALSEVVNTWHAGANEGKIPAVILVVYAGTDGMPVSLPRPKE